MSAHDAYHGARRSKATRGGSPSDGRLPSAVRYASTSPMGLHACTTGQWARSAARPSSVSTMPPPHATTAPRGRSASVSLSSATSFTRKAGQPSALTLSMIAPCRDSKASSRSMKGRPSAEAVARPRWVLPAPRMPMITTVASAFAFAASVSAAPSVGGAPAGAASVATYVAPRWRAESDQNSGYVLSTHDF